MRDIAARPRNQESHNDPQRDHDDVHTDSSTRLAAGVLEGDRRRDFDCLAEDAICRLGAAQWNGREAIRANLRAFIDTGFTALHDVVEYWDGGSLKVFRGSVTMTPDDRTKPVVMPVMTHFFYMDDADPTKVRARYGSVGPIAF